MAQSRLKKSPVPRSRRKAERKEEKETPRKRRSSRAAKGVGKAEEQEKKKAPHTRPISPEAKRVTKVSPSEKKKTSNKHVSSREAKRASKASPSEKKKTPSKHVSSREAKRVNSVLNQLKKSYSSFEKTGIRLLDLTDRISDAAVQKHVDALVKDLVKRQVLGNLLALFNAFEKGNLPGELQSMALIPEALLEWFEDQFDLVPYKKKGEEIDVLVASLDRNYQYNGDAPHLLSDIVKVRIREPGWKHSGVVVGRPLVEFIEASENVTS